MENTRINERFAPFAGNGFILLVSCQASCFLGAFVEFCESLPHLRAPSTCLIRIDAGTGDDSLQKPEYVGSERLDFSPVKLCDR